MPRRHAHALAGLLFLAATAANGSAADEPTPSPATETRSEAAPSPAARPAPSPAPAATKPTADTGYTGILDEEGFKALHQLRGDAAPPARGQWVELPGGRAYLSLPEGAEPPLPGVIVIQEWWGLNDNVKHWTDRLAADGYAALAVDLYGGKVTTTPDEAMAAMKSVDDQKSINLLLAAHDFLQQDARIRALRTASIGWCFGGYWSLRTAMAVEDLDAAVIYYGRLVSDPDQLKAIRASILGVFGDKDASIPPEAVDAFDRALAKAGVDHRILRYDADHAFANPSGPKYDEADARAAWSETREFLARKLKDAAR